MNESNRRSYDPSRLEVEPSTAGASGAGDLVCSVNVNGQCQERASEILLVRTPFVPWEAFPRCPNHPACDYELLVKKMHSNAETLIVEVGYR